ncbi:hypothetical protein PIB30_018743 [Stylosanthes scabra]|uniref:Wall-associated receptor kinase C-terminal domain-containing protein n=1 Tax=Stylosanthes scabra TaxID=79078 RepID=A0ABU6Z4S3_9FABA|nr:hypothetical protein [Stylosanthes scabra]
MESQLGILSGNVPAPPPENFAVTLILVLNVLKKATLSQPSVAGAVPIKCLINGQGRKSYVFEVGKDNIGERTWTSSCADEVTVAVKHDQIQNGDLISGFGAAMSKGFVLDWSRAVDCAECELSDGYCAYNGTTRQTICICKDGRTVGKSCNRKGTLPWPSNLWENLIYLFLLSFT